MTRWDNVWPTYAFDLLHRGIMRVKELLGKHGHDIVLRPIVCVIGKDEANLEQDNVMVIVIVMMMIIMCWAHNP